MAFHGNVPPPPVPEDPKAIRALAKQNHENALGLTQDVAHIGGWIWTALRWPFRFASQLVRRS